MQLRKKANAGSPKSYRINSNQQNGFEVVKQRSEYGKTFALGKRQFQTVIYPHKVHELEKGRTWRDVDNRLVMIENETGNRVFENQNGLTKVQLQKMASLTPLVAMTDCKEKYILWTLENALAVEGVEQKAEAYQSEDDRRAKLDHSVSVVRYSSIMPHTDLVCEINSYGLKESLILHSSDAPRWRRKSAGITVGYHKPGEKVVREAG